MVVIRRGVRTMWHAQVPVASKYYYNHSYSTRRVLIAGHIFRIGCARTRVVAIHSRTILLVRLCEGYAGRVRLNYAG
jgi:hypothetical protein